MTITTEDILDCANLSRLALDEKPPKTMQAIWIKS